jgi:hypothetical protein
MFDFLLAAPNLPFAVALLLMLMIGLVEAVGLGSAAAQLDIGADADSQFNLLGWLGFGQMPLLIVLVIFLALFGMIGIAGQQLATAVLGAPVSPWIAAPVAAVAAMPLLGATARAAGRLIPGEETTAINRDSLVGKRATVSVGVARMGSPARATVRDHFGQVHHVMVEPTLENTDVAEGESLLLVRREGDIFIGMAEGETLSLTLENRPGLFR